MAISSIPIDFRFENISARILAPAEELAGYDRGTSPGIALNRFPLLTKKLDGLQDGFVYIGGLWNMGKSCLQSNLALDALMSDPNVYVLDFSLDDNIDTRLQRYVANLSGTPINIVKVPKHADGSRMMLEKRMAAFNYVTETLGDRLFIMGGGRTISYYDTVLGKVDSAPVSDVRMIDNIVKRFWEEYIAPNKNRKLIVLIDSYHDLIYKNAGDIYEKDMEICNCLGDIQAMPNVTTMFTVQLNKENSGGRPTSNQITGASRLSFEAKVIILVYEEWVRKPGTTPLQVQVQSTIPGDSQTITIPVMEVNIEKNKGSDGRGVVFMAHSPSNNQVIEIENKMIIESFLQYI